MVDNASVDDSVDFVSRNFPSVKIERSKVNLGYAGGCNRGASLATGGLVVFLNSDVEVSREWLGPLVEACSRPGAAVSGGKMLFQDFRDRVYSAGGVLNLFSVPIDRGFLEMDVGQFDTQEDMAYVSGAAMMVDREIFKMLGGFDSSYFAYCEEVDFCLRAWIAGYHVAYTPSSIVYHAFGGSFGRPSPRRRFLGVRNMIYTLVKVFKLKNLSWLLLIYIAFRFSESVILALSGRAGYLRSFISAVASVPSELPRVLEERRRAQKSRRVDDSAVLRFIVSPAHLKWLLKRAVFRSILQGTEQSRSTRHSLILIDDVRRWPEAGHFSL
jgi:GT2 family glycosyltransferase